MQSLTKLWHLHNARWKSAFTRHVACLQEALCSREMCSHPFPSLRTHNIFERKDEQSWTKTTSWKIAIKKTMITVLGSNDDSSQQACGRPSQGTMRHWPSSCQWNCLLCARWACHQSNQHSQNQALSSSCQLKDIKFKSLSLITFICVLLSFSLFSVSQFVCEKEKSVA